jgi:hypothetical protein
MYTKEVAEEEASHCCLDNVVPSSHAEYARLWLRWDNEQGSVLH